MTIKVNEINPLKLPSLPLVERSQLPKLASIYFVLQEETVLYIGRAINLFDRWTCHHRFEELRYLQNVKISWLEFHNASVDLLVNVEKILIKHFRPKLNNKDLGRRENPDYSRITGLVNRELAKRVKVFVANNETTISEVVEKALEKYLNEFEEKS